MFEQLLSYGVWKQFMLLILINHITLSEKFFLLLVLGTSTWSVTATSLTETELLRSLRPRNQ